MTSTPSPIQGDTDKILKMLREKDAEAVKAIGHLMEPREVTLYAMAADEIERLRRPSSPQGGNELQWQPIETAPKQRVILLWALTDAATGNYKTATGNWFPGYGDGPGGWEWDGRRLKDYDVQPTHWQPLPAPRKETP